ncbi:galactonate dehydratase [Paenibacillus sp. FSL H7-0357]|uniref:galactonate dehydratase n=1 Tax=Paenibacillus sp. FSL H7-0357 TaxID=1536774 RepID=UPI0004F79E40|nr:galactonate dehydratase [Paenibacillus sp. FSL H7-0357]AIQ18377.1 galactonate dehydratase [Paenibacillus sp. FSL H7-0357]
MKITGFETFIVPPRWLFLKIETDEGISGWGEPVVEGKAHTVQTAVEEMMDLLIGQDPQRIEDLWQLMYRGGFYRGGAILMSAIAGIDQALWDIKGKIYNAPVYQLLGGACRNSMRVYSWIGGDRPIDVVKSALEKKAAGFTAIKMNASEEMQFIDTHDKVYAIVERVAAIREACGPEFGIAVDFHGRLHKPMARGLARELDPYRLMFIEEPVLPENNEVLREIAHHTSTPIATGERMFSRWDFKNLLKDGVVDIIQPDLSHAGGITECKKIFAMAEAFDVAVAPHCPLGPIALAACLQVDATSYNAVIQEQSLGIHYNQGNDLLDYITDPTVFAYSDGHVNIPSGPGLGITVNEEYVRKMAESGHRWRNPVWRHRDGSIAEW